MTKIVSEYLLQLYYKKKTVFHQQEQLRRNLNIYATIIYTDTVNSYKSFTKCNDNLLDIYYKTYNTSLNTAAYT